MKSTQKFLCYSLALVGAALMFSVGCKKGDTVAGPTYPIYNTQVPTLGLQQPKQVVLSGGLNTVAPGSLSFSTAGALDLIAAFGASTPTTGFYVYAWGVTTTTNPVTLTWGSAAAPMTIGAASATALGVDFSAALSTTASYAALSPCVTGSGTVTWVVTSFATNSSGTVTSALSTTIKTVL